ncbi:MAG: S-methyl-5-thioribose-1-phosphate isomerase [Chloroflexi bacterium]|nr:MAG: S-methyl-5-thioribose-1-phosphate isomerase [Chloroflexota bacterium]
MPTLEWTGSALRLIDQTKLPDEESYVVCATSAMVAKAIRSMIVRGAPAIGAAAAYGAVLALRESDPKPGLAAIRSSRPTARDLAWALDRVLAAPDPLQEADRIARESVDACRRMGQLGAGLLPNQPRILTICNTGALATVDYGTALGVVRAAQERGLEPSVLVMETRPRAQGARLTTWELRGLGIPHRLIADGAAGRALQEGMVDVALAGADRIAANGDVANKVGTYPLALLCREHGVPFYVVAPLSTIDFYAPDGAAIPIEERDEREVTTFAPAGTRAFNPAFDITPAALVTSVITQLGVLRPPLREALSSLRVTTR